MQSPFNRKMEQSANRKRKGLIKTHPAPSWRSPATETGHRLSWEEQELCTAPDSTDKPTQSWRRAKGGFFIEEWAGGYHNTFTLLRKTKQVLKVHSHEFFFAH